MSYILEALKKSEQERRRGEVPEINRFEANSGEEGNKTWLWPAVAVALIAVNLVILVVWAPWKTSESGSEQARQSGDRATPAMSATARQAADTVTVAPAIPPTIKPREPSKTPVKEPAKTASVTAEPGNQRLASDPQPEPEIIRPRSQTVPAPEPEPEVIRPSGGPRTSYLPQLQELPMDVQQRVPDMSFSSHMYSSEPRFRSIIINGRRLKEGQYLNDTIQVREITDKGVVLSMDGTLFEVDVLGQWVN